MTYKNGKSLLKRIQSLGNEYFKAKDATGRDKKELWQAYAKLDQIFDSKYFFCKRVSFD